MKTRITRSALFALAIAMAGACSSNGGDDDDDQPQPGNAYLTIVGDANVFIENGWRQSLTVKYHDGDQQPLAGLVEFSVVGASGGGTLSAPSAATDAEGKANVDVIAGAQGDASFIIRAEAEYADPVEFHIAVTAGDPPLPPLDPTGKYNVKSEFDVVSGLPGEVGTVINTFIDMTDGPNDPATWLIDLVLDEVDNSSIESVISAFRPALDGIINDLLLDLAPDFVADIIEIGDKFGQISKNFGTTTVLDVHQTGGGVEGDELQADHKFTGMFFTIDAQTYTFANDDLNVDDQNVTGLSFHMENENRVFIGAHQFDVPYGALLLVGLNQVIIPMVDPYATNLTDLFTNAVDCHQVGISMFDALDFGSVGIYEGACDLGLNAAAGFIQDQLTELQGMDLDINGEAKPMDTNTDAKVDVLLNGEWNGTVSYLGTPATLQDSTFRGDRQNLP
jgi:hypothetical protein